MIKELIRLASHLDQKGLVREADYLDRIIKESSSFHFEKADEAARRLFEIKNDLVDLAVFISEREDIPLDMLEEFRVDVDSFLRQMVGDMRSFDASPDQE